MIKIVRSLHITLCVSCYSFSVRLANESNGLYQRRKATGNFDLLASQCIKFVAQNDIICFLAVLNLL